MILLSAPLKNGDVDHTWQRQNGNRYLSLCGQWRYRNEIALERRGDHHCRTCRNAEEREGTRW